LTSGASRKRARLSPASSITPYLLLAAIAISLAAWALEGAQGMPFEALVIAVIVAANAVLGFVQERKAEQAVAALQRMAAPTATVLRDGQQVRGPADILVLAEGDAVGADARLLQVSSLTVAESSLTGESEPVLKMPPTCRRRRRWATRPTWCSAARR